MASLSLLWRWQLSLDPFTQDTATSHSLLANLLPAPLKSQAPLSPPGLKPYSRSHGLPSSHILSVCTMIQISNPIPSKILTFTFFLYQIQGQNSGPNMLYKSPASKAHSQTRIHSFVFCPNENKYYPNTLQDGGPLDVFFTVYFSLSVLSPRLKPLSAASTENHIHSAVSCTRSFCNLESSRHALMIIFTFEQTPMR